MRNTAVTLLIVIIVVMAGLWVGWLISANGETPRSVAETTTPRKAERSSLPVEPSAAPGIVAHEPAAKETIETMAEVAPKQAAMTEADPATVPDSETVVATGSEAQQKAEGKQLGDKTSTENLVLTAAPATQDTLPQQAEEEIDRQLAGIATAPIDPSLYERARWHPVHFKPGIDSATNEQCLACHSEILTRKVRETSPAGVEAAKSLAWYQTLDTYAGDQATFHQRHLIDPFAQKVMNLKCNFCHQGDDPREEAPGSSATAPSPKSAAFTLRKVINPSTTCLLCHGKFPYEIMEGVDGPWHKVRADLEDPQDPDLRNGCLTCHDPEFGFRSVRHQVTYLKADTIERLAKEGSSDVCYGCHGGRAWYRNSYPYPRHAWPDMAEEVPEWAKNRPTESDPRYAIEKK